MEATTKNEDFSQMNGEMDDEATEEIGNTSESAKKKRKKKKKKKAGRI